MPPQDRPPCIAHWTDIEEPDTRRYRGEDELLRIGGPFGRHFGLEKLGIHHHRLPPGRRSSFPHAESAQEEFVYVIEGTPDLWLDGHLHRLAPGDGVGFPAGTGISHCFLNNTEADVRLLVVGERDKPENRLLYPLHPYRKALLGDEWWDNPPPRPLGDHDGLPDALRAAKSAATDKP
jgi:uncharacterized cupin superfamily protein